MAELSQEPRITLLIKHFKIDHAIDNEYQIVAFLATGHYLRTSLIDLLLHIELHLAIKHIWILLLTVLKVIDLLEKQYFEIDPVILVLEGLVFKARN